MREEKVSLWFASIVVPDMAESVDERRPGCLDVCVWRQPFPVIGGATQNLSQNPRQNYQSPSLEGWCHRSPPPHFRKEDTGSGEGSACQRSHSKTNGHTCHLSGTGLARKRRRQTCPQGTPRAVPRLSPQVSPNWVVT